MTLIKSISGIRGTIGGSPGEGLTPFDIVKFAAAFGTWIRRKSGLNKLVIGRDARPSGPMVNQIVCQTLTALGIDVVDIGLTTTPTVEIAVPLENAGGGIIITASHNPIHWNALKLLNQEGEFISAIDGKEVLEIASKDTITFVEVNKLGTITQDDSYLGQHIRMILDLPLVDKTAISQKEFRIVVDAVNSTGGLAIPPLLEALGVKDVYQLNCKPTGYFKHNPEPLPENLYEISNVLKNGQYDLGIAVDPDVDRLALICEDGEPFGEEYTLVAVADYVLKNNPGNTVSNLSSSQALRYITEKSGNTYSPAAVGEVNVVSLMKETQAVIGGEGNGGVIYPDLHYGRDALAGIALFLSHLARSGKRTSQLLAAYPHYVISKNKIELTPEIDVDNILDELKKKYASHPVNTTDGVKIEFPDPYKPSLTEWVHLRKSNTEPIIRIYAESDSEANAVNLAQKIISDISELVSSKV
ncbi:MAG: phosphoglucosamine mutase [Bacteroidetes bacterium]|nr:phosphoglucosamine mutase [Bacteroidota bacterium]